MSNSSVNNISARTFALPDKLLLEIFKINSAYNIYEPRAHIEDTIAYSQVCRQWRHVSLASSALWARCLDYCLGKDWIEEILHRTWNQLLQIIYPLFTPYLDGQQTLLDTLRNQQLRYGHAACDLTDVLIDRLPQCMVYEGEPLPKDLSVFERCRSLSLMLNSTEWDDHYPFLGKHLASIKDITLSCMDPLQGFTAVGLEDSAPWCAETLHLRNISLPLHFAHFQELRCLTVGALKLEAHKLTAGGWLHVLEHMPELRILRLDDAIADASMLKLEDPRLQSAKSPWMDFRIQVLIPAPVIIQPWCKIVMNDTPCYKLDIGTLKDKNKNSTASTASQASYLAWELSNSG